MVLHQRRSQRHNAAPHRAGHLGADPVLQLLEGRRVAHGPAVFEQEIADGGDPRVIDQPRRPAVGVVVHGDALLQRQPLGHLGGVDADIADEQGQGGGDHGGVGGGPGGVHPDLDAVGGGHQRRVGGDLVPVDDGADLLLDRAQGVRGPLGHGRYLGLPADPAHGGADLPGAACDEGAEVLIGVDGPAVLVDGPVGHPQVRGQGGGGEVACVDAGAAQFAQGVGELVGQRALVGGEFREGAGREVGGGYHAAAQTLGQAADQFGDQFLAQAGDQPVEAFGVHTRQQGDRDEDGDAVLRVAGFEAVGQFVVDTALAPAVGEGLFGDPGGVVAEQGFGVEVEQVGFLLAGFLPPGVEVAGGGDVGGEAFVVEVEEGVLVDDDAASTCLLLDLCGGLQFVDVGVEEGVVGGPVALDQGVPDEHVAGGLGVDAVVGDQAVGDDGHPVEGGLLVGHRGCAFT